MPVPPKRKQNKVYRKTTGKSKRSKFRIYKSAQCANQMMLAFKYVDNLALSPTGGTPVYYQFRGNSIYDPDYTGTGTQPIGFDQWCNFYDNYNVIASRIRVRAYNTTITSGTTVNAILAVFPSVKQSYSITTDGAVGQVHGKNQITTYNTQIANISNYMSTHKLYGKSRQSVLDDDGFSSAVSTNPTKDWYWNIVANNPDESTSITLRVEVEITYYVKMFGRTVLGMS